MLLTFSEFIASIDNQHVVAETAEKDGNVTKKNVPAKNHPWRTFRHNLSPKERRNAQQRAKYKRDKRLSGLNLPPA